MISIYILALYKSWVSNYDEEDSDLVLYHKISHCEYYEPAEINILWTADGRAFQSMG